MKTILLMALLCCMTSQSQAMSPFEQHLKAVSQSTSAFYMYLLSDGDKRYMRQFKNSMAQAHQSLMASSDSQAFFTRWQVLNPKLTFSIDDEGSLSLARNTRFELREYLADAFLHYQKKTVSNNQINALFDRIHLANLLLAARALDTVSADYGSHINPDLEYSIDQNKVARQIEQDIKILLTLDIAPHKKVALRRISSKFTFLKASLVNYETKTPYFLLYSNISSINKLLSFQRHAKRIATND